MKTEDEVDFQKDGTEELVSAGLVTLYFAVLCKEMLLLLWPAGFLSAASAKLNNVQWRCFSLLKIAWAFLALAFSTAGWRHFYIFSACDRLSQEVPHGARLYQDLCVIWREPGMHLRLVMLCGGQQHLQGGPGASVLPSHALFSREVLAEGLWLMLVCAQTLRTKGIMGWGCLCLSWS